MCGIAGFVGRATSIEQSSAELSAMCDAIWHRGPDEGGQYVAPGVALGMRRLSVIDVAGGSQPIRSEDGSITAVFNGEIYNHRLLRIQLAHRHVLRSRTDSEVLVHLYEDLGDRFVNSLRGMFAIALWDASRERLLLVRDRLGIKPLYYWDGPLGLVFGSELRALLALQDYPHQLDIAAVHDYLALGYVPDPRSIFSEVRKLPPGHVLSWSRSEGITLRQYWSPVRDEMLVTDERDCVMELRRLFTDAVQSHLESDVPLGAFLSGGIDSSAVVAEMTKHVNHRVRTFSIGFNDAHANEAPYARKVATALGTQHTEFIVQPSADSLLEDVVRCFDEPFADSSALPMLVVAQVARRDVTVALSGDGGDELFAGYSRYSVADSRLPVLPARLGGVLRAAVRCLPHSTLGRNKLLDVTRNRRGRYAARVAHSLPEGESGVVADGLVGGNHSLDQLLERWFAPAAHRDYLTQLMLVDVASYLPGDILTKVDRTTMRVSLEARVPMLDHPLVEFALALPSRLKRREGVGKRIFRCAIEPLVPAFVFRRPKHGFRVPLARWFRTDLQHRLNAFQREGRLQEFVEARSIQRLAREHLAGRRDHSAMLWRLLVLESWLAARSAGELGRPHSFSSIRVEAAGR